MKVGREERLRRRTKREMRKGEGVQLEGGWRYQRASALSSGHVASGGTRPDTRLALITAPWLREKRKWGPS